MRGQNPKRTIEKGDGGVLQLVEIFPTLQGEGPHAGVPAVFVRLGGCNLACNFCDTEFEDFKPVTCDDLLGQVMLASHENASARTRHLVVITGGEPMRQNIVPLCEALIAEGFTVQIETNGTIFRPLPDAVDIVCSPKAVDGRYYPLRPDMLARVNALKFLIDAEDGPYQTVPDIGQNDCDRDDDLPIYLQPIDCGSDSRNRQNMAHAVALCGAHGYRLSLQTHKILGIA